jgi:hypothetical protein
MTIVRFVCVRAINFLRAAKLRSSIFSQESGTVIGVLTLAFDA